MFEKILHYGNGYVVRRTVVPFCMYQYLDNKEACWWSVESLVGKYCKFPTAAAAEDHYRTCGIMGTEVKRL